MKDQITRVGIDVDGVLTFGFAQYFVNKANMLKHTSYTLEDITEWDMAIALKLTDAQAKECYAHAAQACMDYIPTQEAIDFINELKSMPNVEIYYVTSPWPSENFASNRYAWLQLHFDASPKQIVLTASKSLLAGTLDFLIDDKRSNITAFKEARLKFTVHPTPSTYLFPTPYNLGCFRERSFESPLSRISHLVSLKQPKEVTPEPGQVWKHYKGTHYRIVAFGTHSESQEPYVCYEHATYPDTVWIRPYSMWHDEVSLGHRFELTPWK